MSTSRCDNITISYCENRNPTKTRNVAGSIQIKMRSEFQRFHRAAPSDASI